MTTGTKKTGGAGLFTALLAAALVVGVLGMLACGSGGPTVQTTPTAEPTSVVTGPTPTPFTGDTPTIWVEDFESYGIGTFPREGRWQRWKSGGVNEVTTETSAGGSKSYKVADVAYTAKQVPMNLPAISYTGKFMASSTDESLPSPVVLIGLGWKMEDGNVPHASSCGVWIGGRLRCGSMDLGPAEAGRWYEVHATADLVAGTAHYWLDGEDLGSQPLEKAFGVPRDNISHFLIVNGLKGVEAFVDNVAVFEGEVPPLTP